jgi:rare lipoprotein A (peptidoglycan hydrolase)
MARLSTGQTYGEASRATAAQLLGGIPTDAFTGALAQGSINTPSLQPKAAPVETFQRVGAPTLGGAPQFFAPPKLPDPGSDLANLARSLGGFSSTLQSFGETFLANKQEQEKKQEAASAAFVGQTGQYGPARTIADLAANLEKSAALGNTDAARMLQIVREKQGSSYGRYFLERSIEQNAISSAALSLPDQIAATSTIQVDGKEVNFADLSSTDPRYLAHRDKLLFGGVQMSTTGYAKNQQLIMQAMLQADEVKRKQFNTAQVAKESSQLVVNRGVITRDYFNGGATTKSVVLFLENNQRQLDYIKSLTIPQEEKTKLTNDWINGVALDLVSAAKDKKTSITNLRAALAPLKMLMTGPVEDRIRKDGTRNESLLLYNTLGGEAYFDQVVAKAEAVQIQDNSQRAQVAGIAEQQAFDARLKTTLPQGRRSDPAVIKSFFQGERERAATETDGIKRAAMFSQIDASERQLTETYIKPVQEQRSLWYAQQLDVTRNDEAARNRVSAQLQADLAAGVVTSATATSIQTTLSAQGSKQVQSYRKDISKRVDDILKDYEAYVTSPGSYGREAINGFEYQTMYNARSMATRRLEESVDQAIKEGKDPTEAMNKVQLNNNFGLRKREDVGGTQEPKYTDTTQLIQKNTGNWSRNTIAPRDANELRSQAKVRPLMESGSWDRDVTSLLNGAPSQNFRTLLKTLTTGPGAQKPSEVILNQFKLLGIDVPENERQKIQALDGQKISAVPAPRRQTTPQQNQALAGIQIVGRSLGNALVPAAQAQTAPPLPQARDMSMFYANPETPPKATKVAMAPPPPRPKPATNFPARVTEVGYYGGGGGQDGVAGGRTANGEIYNPKKMTAAVQWSLRGKLLNKWVLVEDAKTGKSIRVWVNDVGPLLGDEKRTGARHLDLSSAAFTKLAGSTKQGLARIRYKIDPNQSGRP